VPVYGDLVAEFDRARHKRHTEVFGGHVAVYADSNPGEHLGSMTQ
jgi:hypothetical protein